MNVLLSLLVTLGALLLPFSLQAQVSYTKSDGPLRTPMAMADSTHRGGIAASGERRPPVSTNLNPFQEHQKKHKGIERRIAAYFSAQDDMGLARYLDSVLLHVELPKSRYLELQLYLSSSLREARDLDRAISVGHAVLSGARAGKFTSLQSRAIANLAYCYTYAGLSEKAEEWENRALAFARRHGFNNQIIDGLSSLGYRRMNAGDFAGTRAAFEEILSLSKNVPLSNDYVQAKGGLLNSYVFEDKLYSEEALKLLQEVKTLSERAELFSSAHGRRDLLGILCNYFNKAGQPQIALSYARKHLAHVSKFSPDTSEIVRFALQQLYPAEAAAHDYEAAYQTMLRLQEVDEVMSKRSQMNELAEASIKLDVHNHEVARLAAERATQLEQQAKDVRTRLLLIISLLAAFIISGTLFGYRRLYRDRQLIVQQNQIVNQSLSEKEVLLREIHHRVKNNLQIISSLLQKQARQSDSQELKDMIQDGQERIQSMALIHQNLYQSDQLGGVNINEYLLDLTQSVEKSHGSDPGNINIELQVANEHLDIDTAIPLGLILNELITNAYKYAFPDGQVGKVIIKFYREAEQYVLQVSDDGVGLPSDYEVRKSHSLGLNLVNGLVRQLEGTIGWQQKEEGTAVSIRF